MGWAHSAARPCVPISFLLTHIVHFFSFFSYLADSKSFSARPCNPDTMTHTTLEAILLRREARIDEKFKYTLPYRNNTVWQLNEAVRYPELTDPSFSASLRNAVVVVRRLRRRRSKMFFLLFFVPRKSLG